MNSTHLYGIVISVVVIWVIVTLLKATKEFQSSKTGTPISVNGILVKKTALETFEFQSGDLILTQSVSSRPNSDVPSFDAQNIGGALTRSACNSKWNHVGVIYNDLLTGEPYIWEMVNSGRPRLMPIRDLQSDTYHCRYFTRPLLCHNMRKHEREEILQKRMTEVISLQQSHLYTTERVSGWAESYAPVVSLLSPILDTSQYAWHNGTMMSCCPLVLQLYHAAGIMDLTASGISPHNVFPQDFADSNSHLPFCNNYSLGTMVELLFNRKERG